MRTIMFFVGFLLAGPLPALANPELQTETLLRSTTAWDGTPYTAYPPGQPELTVLKIVVPSHTTLAWHRHPSPNAGYILSGKLIVEKKKGGVQRVLTQGQVLPELVGALHRGRTGSSPAELIVFYAGAEGVPLTQP
ncbi:hypothetical protein PTE30175_02360 [Pandoraea terrae]|uniref:Cupin n=1 Tax=Pandoraea terrae TaxID=1537710 RepID=A0A5E4V514_9BURK|nr:cupin domain-containing protein [Pandoraea terrae]VVE06933.1 hypothetical protein PTE30175_02360 [Pandoraea terrae]